jgi:hypothetical protein
LPDEVIDWLKRGHPEEELDRVRELMAALPAEDMDAFTDALIALELYHKRLPARAGHVARYWSTRQCP